MNIHELEPIKLNNFYFYIQAMNFLVKSLTEFESNPIDLIEESNKISDATFEFQEILSKIYELLPIKIANSTKKNMNNISFDPALLYPEDNLFSKNLHQSFICNRLWDIINESNQWFFFFNYFLRNAHMHYRHQVDSPGQLGSKKGITVIRVQIVLDNTARSFDYIESFQNNNSYLSRKFHDEVSITTVQSQKREYYIEAWINIEFVQNLVKHIRSAFVESIKELKAYVSSTKPLMLESLYGVGKFRYLEVISSWEKTIKI